jgi:hypothetical protein
VQVLPDGCPAVQVPPVDGQVMTQALLPPPDVQALKFPQEGVVPPDDV